MHIPFPFIACDNLCRKLGTIFNHLFTCTNLFEWSMSRERINHVIIFVALKNNWESLSMLFHC